MMDSEGCATKKLNQIQSRIATIEQRMTMLKRGTFSQAKQLTKSHFCQQTTTINRDFTFF